MQTRQKQFFFLVLLTVLVSATLFINVLVDADAKSKGEKIADRAEKQGEEMTEDSKDTLKDIGNALEKLGK
jgi:hypothetical protein